MASLKILVAHFSKLLLSQFRPLHSIEIERHYFQGEGLLILCFARLNFMIWSLEEVGIGGSFPYGGGVAHATLELSVRHEHTQLLKVGLEVLSMKEGEYL